MIILPDVDLSTAMVGSTGTILLQNMGIGAGGVSSNPSVLKNLPTLFMHNESGCGLSIILRDSQKSFNIAAGQWVPIAIGSGESAIQWKVKYILPNAPVNLLLTTYYFPGEPIPNIAVLGNSPIGIGGSVNNVANTTLTNEGNAINTLVEDIGTPTTAQLLQIWNDHFSWRVEQSAVAHQVLKGQTSGNPLQIGQAGDNTEVLGALIVDQLLTCLGIVANPAAVSAAGNVTGNVSLYQVLRGTPKLVFLDFANYRSSVTADLALPVAFTDGCLLISGDIGVSGTGGIRLLSSGIAYGNMQSITTLSSAGGNTTGSITDIFRNEIMWGVTAFDTIRVNVVTSAITNFVFIIGN